jgi:hypothetical protein
MQVTFKAEYERMCKELSNMFQGALAWKWDNRFEAVLTEFNTEKKAPIRDLLDRHLNYIWDRSMIDKAPEAVRKITGKLGGLMTGQLLFTSDPEQDAVIFCAWWPWGDGGTVSIRIAPAYVLLSELEKSELIKQSKTWFGL